MACAHQRRVGNDGIGGDMGGDVGLLPILLGIALQDGVAEGVDGGGNLNVIAAEFQALKCIKETFEDTEVSGCADGARIGWEAEQDHADLLLGVFFTAQGCKAARLFDEGVYVSGFFYPVVPHRQARIRTQMSAAHSIADLDQALEAFGKVGRELGVIS